jgi:hypothetical protein
MMRKMRWRSRDWQPAQRGILPFGAIRPFGPGTKTVDPQIGQRLGVADSELASKIIAASSHP